MTTDIVTHNSSSALEMSVAEKQNYAQILATANMIPKAFQDNPANIFVAIEYGNALGIQPIVALNEINVINGSPSLSASMMASLARSAGHKVRTQNLDDGSAVCEIIRHDDPEFTHRSVWDEGKARGAGLWGKGHWSKDPETMLRWRAISECVRMACPEVLGGLKYTPEEVMEFTAPASVSRPASMPARGAVSRPAPVKQQPSGRDWIEELNQCETSEQVKQLAGEITAAGAATDEIKTAINEAWQALRDGEQKQDGPAADPVTGEVIEGEVA